MVHGEVHCGVAGFAVLGDERLGEVRHELKIWCAGEDWKFHCRGECELNEE